MIASLRPEHEARLFSVSRPPPIPYLAFYLSFTFIAIIYGLLSVSFSFRPVYITILYNLSPLIPPPKPAPSSSARRFPPDHRPIVPILALANFILTYN